MSAEVHYANLTNGLLCAPDEVRYTRIPSAWCEQKQWGKVLYGAGADLLTVAAVGRPVIVHDQSERQRFTRAQWQGLSWLRYACSMAFGLGEVKEVTRGGANVTSYWRGVWLGLDRADRNWLEYFGEAATAAGTSLVDIRPCECAREPWSCGDGKELMRRIP